MKAKILSSALLLGVLGLGQGGSLEGASGGWAPSPWIGFLPDLYVSNHVKIDYGSYVAVGFSVRNGGLRASGPFAVTVISPYSSFDISYSGLGAGQSQFRWIIVSKRIPAGTPYFFAVDSHFAVGESNETNNLYAFTAP